MNGDMRFLQHQHTCYALALHQSDANEQRQYMPVPAVRLGAIYLFQLLGAKQMLGLTHHTPVNSVVLGVSSHQLLQHIGFSGIIICLD